ncbi:hypothetical protein [Streptomyces sp. NPDC086777]|uniref:hypothetical protein n=1 Tax=Streptomyces sp. NPDC086777 TaxID=3154866 RepID=UPI00344D5E18
MIRRPPERPGTVWHEGDARLAGGTWLWYDAYSVYTNTVPSGALRGYGKEAPPPSLRDRTSLAFRGGLYPTVVLLTLALSPCTCRSGPACSWATCCRASS